MVSLNVTTPDEVVFLLCLPRRCEAEIPSCTPEYSTLKQIGEGEDEIGFGKIGYCITPITIYRGKER